MPENPPQSIKNIDLLRAVDLPNAAANVRFATERRVLHLVAQPPVSLAFSKSSDLAGFSDML